MTDLSTRMREHAENCAGRYDVTGYTVLREAADALDNAVAIIDRDVEALNNLDPWELKLALGAYGTERTDSRP